MSNVTRTLVQTAAALALAVSFVGPAQAATISVDNTNPQSIPGLTGFTTDGSMMSGMSVTVYMGDGFSETRFWATTGATSGGVTGSGWSLSLTGDSFTQDWTFTNDTGLLTRLVLDGSTGLTVFDKSLPFPGTDGSASGRDFATSLAGDPVTATYRNPVGIGAFSPDGDVFQIVDVDFRQFGNGGVTGRFTFDQDTDNDSRFSVPEPSLLALFGLGLVGTIRARRRARG